MIALANRASISNISRKTTIQEVIKTVHDSGKESMSSSASHSYKTLSRAEAKTGFSVARELDTALVCRGEMVCGERE